MEIILIPIIISLTHFLGHTLDIHKFKVYPFVKSFSAGISAGYVFLFLLPDIVETNSLGVEEIFIFVLISFTIFHIIHKIIIKETDDKESQNLIEIIDGGYMSLYSFIATFLILDEISTDPFQGFILFMVLIIHSLLFDVSEDDFSLSPQVRMINRLFITIGPLLAGAVFLTELLPLTFQEMLLAFGVGSLIYISIREEIPTGKKGKPLFFAIGAIIIISIVLSF